MAETWWERADRERRARRVPLKAIAAPLGKTESWAGHLMAGRWPDQPPAVLRSIAESLGLTLAELTGDVPVGWGNTRRVGEVRAGDGGRGERRLPIINSVDAGEGPGHDRQAEDWVVLSSSLLGGVERAVVYVISGECLRDALIASGDYLVVDPEDREPEQGEIVVARVNGVEVAKRFYRFGDTVELRPASLGFETVIVRPGDEFEVVGTYVAVVRPARGGRRMPAKAGAGARKEGA